VTVCPKCGYERRPEDGVVVLFMPMLPRDDVKVSLAATEVIASGAHQWVTLQPRPLQGAKVSLWECQGVDSV
jgi:hypothetical protein